MTAFNRVSLFLILTLPFYWLGWSKDTLFDSPLDIPYHYFLNPVIVFDLLWFIIAHLICLTLFYSFTWLIWSAIKPKEVRHQYFLFLLILFAEHFAVIGYLKFHYPLLEVSKLFFGDFYLYTSWGAALFLSVSVCIASYTHIRKKNIPAFMGLVTLCFIIYSPSFPTIETHTIKDTTPDKPNVIILGIDSLSGDQFKQYLPELDALKEIHSSGVYFNEAYTPLARTFPAWTAILTGKYPATSGMRFNLTKPTSSVLADNLARDFQAKGYRTIYAQDERRFNNIDETFGFDKVIGPKNGASDFVIPVFADNFISSFFKDTVMGDWLFPGLYNNRVAADIYRPDQFSQDVAGELTITNKPFFLAAHFCLAHFPYSWNENPVTTYPQQGEVGKHMQAVKRIDQQLKTILDTLKSTGQLENTIIVLISDHGEGIGDTYNTWITPVSTEEQKWTRFVRGHGNSLLSTDQTHILMHISTPHDRETGHYNEVSDLASLVDIRPTISTMTGLPDTTSDGSNLFFIKSDRIIFMETGVTVALPEPGQEELIAPSDFERMVKSYYISESGKLTISNDYTMQQLKNKQIGVMDQDFFLVRDRRPDKQIDILIDKVDRHYRTLKDDETLSDQNILNLRSALHCYSSPEFPSCL